MDYHHIYYRNGKPLVFKIIKDLKSVEEHLPSIIMYVDNDWSTYHPYTYQEIKYVKDSLELNKSDNFDFYFVLKHTLYNNDKIDIFLKSIESDLKSGAYFPIGPLNENPFDNLSIGE